jgi:hypothetical protein
MVTSDNLVINKYKVFHLGKWFYAHFYTTDSGEEKHTLDEGEYFYFIHIGPFLLRGTLEFTKHKKDKTK